MKRWFRPVAYSVVLILAVLAIFGGEAPADVTVNTLPARVMATATQVDEPDEQMPAVRTRNQAAFPVALFAVDSKPVVAAPAPALPPAPTPHADVKILGWMSSGSVPYVFVDWNNESYTLKPTESVGDVYRFDKVEGGFADFTYLPTGEARRYEVSDPALIE